MSPGRSPVLGYAPCGASATAAAGDADVTATQPDAAASDAAPKQEKKEVKKVEKKAARADAGRKATETAARRTDAAVRPRRVE